MNKLTQSAFDQAADFIRRNARPLERSQFEYHFESGSINTVLNELAKFQNDDGGSGHGVEPDVRMPDSSPFVSSVAFQILRELEVPADHPLVRDGIAYFVRSHDESIGGWDPTGPIVDKHPRAPWWNYVPIDGRLEPLKQANPGAEIVGYLHLYGGVGSDEFTEHVTASALQVFADLPEDMEVHAMMCFMRLAEMSTEDVSEVLLPKLRRGVHQVIGTSQSEWEAYGGRPLWFAGTPEGLLADELSDSIPVQLDYEIESQAPDGSWAPNWAWGQFEDVWETAKLEWSGYLTLRNLLSFKAWGRI